MFVLFIIFSSGVFVVIDCFVIVFFAEIISLITHGATSGAGNGADKMLEQSGQQTAVTVAAT